MKRSLRDGLVWLAAGLSLAVAGCGDTTNNLGDGGPGPGGSGDMAAPPFVFPDLSTPGGNTDGMQPTDDGMVSSTNCNDPGQVCKDVVWDPSMGGTKFPLMGGMPNDPNAGSSGVGLDPNGNLILNSTHAAFNYAWTANTDDWQKGTVSKFDTTTVREVARYFTVTCNSLPTGNTNACDGKNGCCAKDSMPQYLNRKAKMPSGPYQQIEMTHINYPSRTAIDFDGQMWVSNRALYQQGAQSSVTKIANDPTQCIDRNKNGKIDTSKDVNGDGIIETDCNGDGMPDDIASVKAKACTNNMAQEFFGLDDECVLLTTNTDTLDMWGRPLGLGPGAQDFGPSDVWAGLFNNHHVYRIDGTTGLTKDDTTLPCTPYGFVIDATAIGWAANLGPAGCYWDTKNPQNVGSIRTTQGQSSYGIGIDRDQNMWFGGTAARYTPNRKGNFMDLGNGYWTVFSGISGSGVAVDARSPKAYFAYFAGQQLYQVPASTIPVPNGMDVTIPANGFPSVPVFGGGGKGVDITNDENVMVTSQSTAGIQRVKVDVTGKMSVPDLQSPPMGNNKCPSGDFCTNTDHGPMNPYTYSDFTGFGLRNYTEPKGSWSYVIQGCNDGMGNATETRWSAVLFNATTPLNTSVTVRVRSGNTPAPDQTWGMWTTGSASSPVDLVNGVQLMPNYSQGNMNVNVDDNWLQVEIDLATTNQNATPVVHSIDVAYDCPNVLG